jgi:hypothetical protein
LTETVKASTAVSVPKHRVSDTVSRMAGIS